MMKKRLKNQLNERIFKVKIKDQLTESLSNQNRKQQAKSIRQSIKFCNKTEKLQTSDNSLQNSHEHFKNLLLKRHIQKKPMIQASSTYVQTGETTKKKIIHLDEKNLVDKMKQASSIRLPFLKRQFPKESQNRLSQTLDPYERKNETISLFDKINEQSSRSICTQSCSKIQKIKLHLEKKIGNEFKQFSSRSTTKSRKKSSIDSINKNNNSQFLGFNQQQKKKYLRSIVDRYFPNEDSDSEKSPNKNSVDEQTKSNTRKIKIQQLKSRLPTLQIQKNKSKKSQQFSFQKQKHEDSFLQYSSSQIMQTQQDNLMTGFISNSSSSPISTLSQSYILQKIDEDDQQLEERKNQDFYGNFDLSNSSPFLTSQSKSIELLMSNSTQDLINLIKQKKAQNLNSGKIKQRRQKIYQNHSFFILKIKYQSFQNISQNKDLKTLSSNYEFRKYFLNEPSFELKNRQLKARSIIQKVDSNPFLISLWQQDQFDKSCLKINLSKISPPCSIRTTLPLTLSKLIYKISPIKQSIESKYMLIKPQRQPKLSLFLTQQKLLQNSGIRILKLIKCLAMQLKSVQTSIINNKLSINNIFLIDQNRYAINQWGYSYFKQDFFIQDKKFQKRLEPIFKNQFNQWFVTPQYLAPQVLENLLFTKDQVVKYWKKIEGKKMEAQIVKQHDLFESGNKSDVWSLGLLILQIITLIPMWIGQKCIVESKNNPKIVPRKGFLYSQKRDLLKILTKQSYLKQNLDKILRLESEPFIIQEWLIKIIHRMIELNPLKRISLSELISLLDAQEKILKKI